MSDMPADLLECRRQIMGWTGLPADAVGILHYVGRDGRYTGGGGYHAGNDLLAMISKLTSDYSKRESARDRPGTNHGSAVDIGDFRLQDGRDQRDLAVFEVAACRRGDPRAADIREIIYTPPGGSAVVRYDRLGIRSTGDSSHLSHGHRSFFRDSLGRRARMDNWLGLLTEFFEGKGSTVAINETDLQALEGRMHALQTMSDTVTWGPTVGEEMELVQAVKTVASDVATIKASLAAAGGSPDIAPVMAAVAALSAKVDALREGIVEQVRTGANLAEDT